MRRLPRPLSVTARAVRLSLAVMIAALSLPAISRAQGTTDSLPTSPTPVVHKKYPALAATLAIIPGAGHVYAGEGGRGLRVLGGIAGFSLAMGFLAVADCMVDLTSDSTTDELCESSAVENVGSAVLLGIWGWSIVDAGKAANRTNRRLVEASKLAQLARVPLTVQLSRRPTASGDDARAVNVGLRFNLR